MRSFNKRPRGRPKSIYNWGLVRRGLDPIDKARRENRKERARDNREARERERRERKQNRHEVISLGNFWKSLSKPAVVIPNFGNIKTLTPQGLERAAQLIFQKLGYSARHTGRSGDHGVDVHLTAPDGSIAIVQCKQEQRPISEEDIRAFYGTMLHHHAKRGFFFAPNGFTTPARQWATNKPIDLCDERRIDQLAQAANAATEKQNTPAQPRVRSNTSRIALIGGVTVVTCIVSFCAIYIVLNFFILVPPEQQYRIAPYLRTNTAIVATNNRITTSIPLTNRAIVATNDAARRTPTPTK